MSEKKIGLITTLNLNIGDEFIRDGITIALEQAFPEHKFNYVMVHKHDPLKFYKCGIFFNFVNRGRVMLAKHLGKSTIFDDCDAIIQCGAPIFWQGCSNKNTWQNHLWYKVLNRYRGKKPILNLCGGSSYGYKPDTFKDIPSPADAQYIDYIMHLADKTTVRDKLAHKIALKYDKDTPFIPCSAFIAKMKYALQGGNRDSCIIINYMKIGGHYDYDMTFDDNKWQNDLMKIIHKFASDGHRIVFLCHNEEEKKVAEALGTKFDIVLPANRKDYLEFAMGAKLGICNRMHCAVVLGSLGIPAIAVGNDTRLLMVEEIGLPNYFIGNVEPDILYNKGRELMADCVAWDSKMAILQQETLHKYKQLMKTCLPF
jgi:hypothetical protein